MGQLMRGRVDFAGDLYELTDPFAAANKLMKAELSHFIVARHPNHDCRRSFCACEKRAVMLHCTKSGEGRGIIVEYGMFFELSMSGGCSCVQ